MSNFTYDVHWLNSPGYLTAEVPSAVAAELRGSMDSLVKNSDTDARTSLRGHLQEEWTLPLTKEISAFTRCLSYEYIKFGEEQRKTKKEINIKLFLSLTND